MNNEESFPHKWLYEELSPTLQMLQTLCILQQQDPHYRCGEHRTCDFSFATTQRRCGHQGWTTAVVCAKTIQNPSRRVHQKGTQHKKTVVPVVMCKYEAGYDNTALTCIYMCGKIESEETVSLSTAATLA